LSSLNRHCLATRSDVGSPKSACLVKHFKEIMPECNIEAMCTMYTDDTEADILSGTPDYVIDAIDNIDTKVSLLAACKSRGIEVLSVAGAGAKADPTRLRFVDICESSVDPLARAVRHRMRRDHNIIEGVTILLSTEKPRCGLVNAGEGDEIDMSEYQIIPNFRIRTIPVLGTTPAIFGMAAAGYTLCHLAEQGIEPEPIFRVTAKSMKTQYDRLEERLGCEPGIDKEETEILVREIWRGMSARATAPPPPKKALSRDVGNLTLTKWNPAKPAVMDNLILLTKEEADEHDAMVNEKGGFEALCLNQPEFVALVERKLTRARNEFLYRYF